jgi:hypothetical protein
MKTKITFKIGRKNISATYAEWEEIFEELEKIFGVEAVEDVDNDPGQTDLIDIECLFDVDLNNIDN